MTWPGVYQDTKSSFKCQNLPVAAPTVPHAQMMIASKLGAPIYSMRMFAGSCAQEHKVSISKQSEKHCKSGKVSGLQVGGAP